MGRAHRRREEGGRGQELEDRPLGRHPARVDEARLPSVRQRQGARRGLELPRRRSRSTASRSIRTRPDLVAKYPTHDDKKAFWRLPTLYKSVQQKNVKDKVGEEVPADPDQRAAWSSTRAAARRRAPTRGSPSCSRRCSSRSTRRRPTTAASATASASGSRRRPARSSRCKAHGHRARRPRHRASCRSTSPAGGRARTCCRTTRRARADRARRGGQHGHDLRLRQRDDDAGNQDDALPGRRRPRANRGDQPWQE